MNHRIPHVRKLDNGLWVLVIDDIQVNMLYGLLGFEMTSVAPTHALFKALKLSGVASAGISTYERCRQYRPVDHESKFGSWAKIWTDNGWVELQDTVGRYDT